MAPDSCILAHLYGTYCIFTTLLVNCAVRGWPPAYLNWWLFRTRSSEPAIQLRLRTCRRAALFAAVRFHARSRLQMAILLVNLAYLERSHDVIITVRPSSEIKNGVPELTVFWTPFSRRYLGLWYTRRLWYTRELWYTTLQMRNADLRTGQSAFNSLQCRFPAVSSMYKAAFRMLPGQYSPGTVGHIEAAC